MAHHRGGGFIYCDMDPDSGSRLWIPIHKFKGREHAPGLSVCLDGLSVCDAACWFEVSGLL